jgi:hypothetical protein
MREDKERAADYHNQSPSGKGEREGSDQPLTGPNHWWRAAEKDALPSILTFVGGTCRRSLIGILHSRRVGVGKLKRDLRPSRKIQICPCNAPRTIKWIPSVLYASSVTFERVSVHCITCEIQLWHECLGSLASNELQATCQAVKASFLRTASQRYT